MSAHGFAHVELLFAQLPREPGALGEEFHFLDDPARAMRVVFFLSDDTSLGVPLTRSDRHRAARYPARADEVPDFRLCFPGKGRTLEILAPENPLALAREELKVIRKVLAFPKLIVRAPMLSQAADDELAAA